MTRVIYVTHNMFSKLISLIDYVDQSTSLMINELSGGMELNSESNQKRNLSESTLSKMNTHTQHVKKELMEIINEQIPFATERKELLRNISATKKGFVESFQDNENVSQANYCIDEKGILRENKQNDIM
jgi:hypothetical protein